MQHREHDRGATANSPVLPWSLLAWPPLLWRAGRANGLQLYHLGTRVTGCDGSAGQTVWGGSADSGEAGVAWDWIRIAHGVVAMADPLSVVTNLRLVGAAGEVLTALEAALFLNEIVHQLPWQTAVTQALDEPAVTQ